MRYWWFKNRLIPFLILFTLVNPDLTTAQPGPSNTETRPKRRKVVAHCKKCGFKADTEVSRKVIQIMYNSFEASC